MRDVLVIGCGPAGLLLATALRARGMSVDVVGPPDPWANVYGAWVDELAPVGLADVALHAWAGVDVHTDGPIAWDRPYCRVDAARLRARLDGPTVADQVVAVVPDATGSDVFTASGRTHRAAVVVDASGARSTLVAREPGPPPLVQTALGWRIRGEHPWPLDRARWMDLRSVAGDDPPTFAYVLPYGPDDVFVEETALARHPAVGPDLLDARLRARLAHDGVRVREVVAVERCAIPMTTPLPVLGQRTLAFGAAAGLVHPATGYQLATAARLAPALADAIVAGLRTGPDAAARLGWEALWPRWRVRTRALYTFGARFSADLDAAGLRRFLGAFFALPPDTRAAWLGDRLAPGELGAAMAAVFAAAPATTRWQLARAAAAEPSVLLRSLTGL